MTRAAALTFDSVVISRRRRRLVREVSFEVLDGSVHALLGHNGAGKTTLLRGLAGLVTLDSGSIVSDGPPAVLFVGGRFPADLSVRSIIQHRARKLGGVDVSGAVATLGVDEFLDVRGAALSTGMAQRLSIVLALLQGARVFVLDEPTSGLDPQGVEQLRDVVLDLRRAGCTVLVCSHDLAELELVCDAVTCLRDGRLTAHGTVAEVSRGLPSAGHVLRTSDDGQAARLLVSRGLDVEVTARGVRVAADVPLVVALDVLSDGATVYEVTVDKGLFARIYDAYAAHAPTKSRGSEASA